MDALQAGIFAFLIFVVTDAIWIGVVAQKFFQQQMGALLRPKIDFVPAAIFYISFLGAILWLAILPALAGGGWTKALVNGAVLGFAAYGAYDLTNLSTVKGWPLKMAIVDLAWGTTLTAVTAAGAVLLAGAI